VRITQEDLVVLSFPGPDRSIRMEDLRAGRAVSRRYRNRRIGEFLKELELTEGRSTGIPKIFKAMAERGRKSSMNEYLHVDYCGTQGSQGLKRCRKLLQALRL